MRERSHAAPSWRPRVSPEDFPAAYVPASVRAGGFGAGGVCGWFVVSHAALPAAAGRAAAGTTTSRAGAGADSMASGASARPRRWRVTVVLPDGWVRPGRPTGRAAHGGSPARRSRRPAVRRRSRTSVLGGSARRAAGSLGERRT
ncbi:hypothetical protein ACFXA3_30505, partial [Streptomyces sp. NPDC059456]